MKKFISLFLVICVVLSLAACGSSSSAKKTGKSSDIEKGYNYGTIEKDKYAGQFRVGYSISDITPVDPALPMSGYGNEANRICRGVLTSMNTRAMAVSDKKNNTVILIQIDIINMYRADIANQIFTLVSKYTGVPDNNIIFNCSHTHSGPAITQSQMTAIQMYVPFFVNTIVSNAVKAMNDRKPSTMYYGDTQVPDHNFVRHYYATDGEGDIRVVGDNHWDIWYSDITNPNKKYLGHAGELDRTFHMIKFAREEGDDIIWMSFRAHNTITGNSYQYLMSADWTGKLCDYVEEAIPGSRAIYFQGDAGNVNPGTRMSDVEVNYTTGDKTNTNDLINYSSTLSEYAIDLEKNLREIPTGLVGGKRFSITFKVNHDLDNLQTKAALVTDFFKKSNDTVEAKRYAYTLGLVSQYQASSITSRARMGTETVFKATAMVISGIGMTFSPGELFNQLGVQIKERSPFDTTISFSYSGATHGYIPDAVAYDNGTYETDTCVQAKGSGEMLVDKFIDVLGELKSTIK